MSYFCSELFFSTGDSFKAPNNTIPNYLFFFNLNFHILKGYASLILLLKDRYFNDNKLTNMMHHIFLHCNPINVVLFLLQRQKRLSIFYRKRHI